MKKTLLCATAAAAFATVGATAHAEDGWYARADAQFSFEGTLDQDGATDVIGTIPGKTTLNETAGASVGLGYGFDNGLRLEGVLGNRAGPLDVPENTNGAIGGSLLANGYASVTDLMMNGLYDFNKGGTVQPYIGLGIGGARVDAKASNRVNAGGSALNGFSDKSTGIAYQGLLGVGFKLSERLTMDLGYKYFTVEDLDFAGKHGTSSYDADYSDHSATLGLRYAFGAPPAPPPPEETTPPLAQQCSALSQEFVVYFEWDRSDLTSQASAVIDQAVANIRSVEGCAAGSVTIVGHTDTSGAADYNARLSVRRADVVAAALTQRGIANTLITQDGKGETALAKATLDGVREPLNRRSEVTIIVQ